VFSFQLDLKFKQRYIEFAQMQEFWAKNDILGKNPQIG